MTTISPCCLVHESSVRSPGRTSREGGKTKERKGVGAEGVEVNERLEFLRSEGVVAQPTKEEENDTSVREKDGKIVNEREREREKEQRRIDK